MAIAEKVRRPRPRGHERGAAWRPDAFRAARIFAPLAPDGKTADLKLAPDEQELKCLLRPDAFAPNPNRWSAQGWTTLRLDAIALPDLRGTLERAWRHAHPRGRRTKRRNPQGWIDRVREPRPIFRACSARRHHQ
jgi:hypothetical protein